MYLTDNRDRHKEKHKANTYVDDHVVTWVALANSLVWVALVSSGKSCEWFGGSLGTDFLEENGVLIYPKFGARM